MGAAGLLFKITWRPAAKLLVMGAAQTFQPTGIALLQAFTNQCLGYATLLQFGADTHRAVAALPARGHILLGETGIALQAPRGQPFQHRLYRLGVMAAGMQLAPQFRLGVFAGGE